MFMMKKIVAAFVLPPGIFVAGLLGAAVCFWRSSRKAAWTFAALGGLLWVFSMNVFGDLLLRPLENAYSAPAAPAAPAGDVIIALGGGAYDAETVFSAGERLSPGSLERMSAAALLHKKTGLPVLVSGGAVFSAMAEADAAAAYLAELGVPAKSIIKESAARDTKENALLSRKLCEERGYKKVILLTSSSHMPRSVYLFKEAGFTDIIPFPVTRTADKARRTYQDFLPGSRNSASRALNEYIGLLFYYVF